MADREPIKSEIEKALVNEIVDNGDYGRSFGRIFNKDNGNFSRIFSRNLPMLAEINPQDLATMDDAVFRKFTERLRSVQEIVGVSPLAELSESSERK
jgi:hypothetical protein